MADIDADPQVRLVLHAGDVKGGSQTCDDARFLDLAGLYGTFDDPFVLTPGDNDWTDCHRANNGSYLPTERLDRIREIFYPPPHSTIGQRPMHLDTQADDPQHSAYVDEAEPAYAGVPNLTRLETFGDTATDWLRVTVDPRTDALFSWEPQVVGS